MVLIMVTTLIPLEKGSQVRRKYNEIQEKYPLPSFIKQKIMGLRWMREDLKGVAVYEVDKGKVAETLNFVYRYEAEFGGIEGFSNDIQTLLTLEESAGMTPSLREIGLKQRGY